MDALIECGECLERVSTHMFPLNCFGPFVNFSLSSTFIPLDDYPDGPLESQLDKN